MKKTIFSILFILLFSIACSNNTIPIEKNIVLQETLVNISADYFNAIIRGDYPLAKSKINQADFVFNERFTVEDMQTQLRTLDGRWTKEEHPLVNLIVLDVDQDGDYATLKFRRGDNKSAPTIEVRLLWTGTGWLINKDNLFGSDGLFASLPPLNEAQKERPGVIRQISK